MWPQPFTLATTTSTPASKLTPSYFQSAPVSQDSIQQKEVLLHLYAYQHIEGRPNANQKIIVDPKLPHAFGTLAANDWIIFDGPAVGDDGNIVARAQGFHIGARMAEENYFICFNMVFVDPRFKGSSFKVMGDFRAEEGEWAIVGGTGEFAYAQGVITYKKTQLATGNLRELHVRALCLSFSESTETPWPNGKTLPHGICGEQPKPNNIMNGKTPVTKIGPWGNMSGEFLDVPAKPHRLESVTIGHGVIIDSLAFSFTDQDGEKYTVGPWGGPNGGKDTIPLAPLEIVTEVSGTIGTFGEAGVEYNVITSLTIVTDVKKYGHFGQPQGNSFNVPVQDNNSIVGFFAHAGKFLEALGVYVRPPLLN